MSEPFDLCAHLGRDKKHLFQKLQPLEKIKDPSKLKFPMWVSEKFDGVFCCALKKSNGTIGIFSRTGEEYLSMEHLKKDLAYGISDKSFVLFEAYIPNTQQSEISGKCRDTKEQHSDLLAYIYLYGTLDNITLTGLNYWNSSIKSRNFPYIYWVGHIQVNSLEEALQLAKEVWARGGEGVVLNEMDAKYQPGKRNASMIKIKKTLSYDLQVVDVYSGTGKYADTLGGLVVRWKNGRDVFISGMTAAQRKAWWNNPALIVGKIVEVHAMAESSKGLLREPRFKGIRFDKLEGDY